MSGGTRCASFEPVSYNEPIILGVLLSVGALWFASSDGSGLSLLNKLLPTIFLVWGSYFLAARLVEEAFCTLPGGTSLSLLAGIGGALLTFERLVPAPESLSWLPAIAIAVSASIQTGGIVLLIGVIAHGTGALLCRLLGQPNNGHEALLSTLRCVVILAVLSVAVQFLSQNLIAITSLHTYPIEEKAK